MDALIVVDMQRLFVDLAGDEGPAVLDAVNARIADTAATGGAVFFTRDIQPTPNPLDDPSFTLHPELRISGPIIDKGPGKNGGFSGFVLSDPDGNLGDGGLSTLAGRLRQERITRVSVVGIAADVCVSATAVDAIRLGYPTDVPLAATAFVHAHPDGDEAAVAHMRSVGVDCR
ncbi:MAG TPA: isochorismatase family cysteine hydrolase [Brevibacterium sp.]|nr:isochorismatase family cysteine hydrolase [Brevibacterium sp.]